MIEAEVHHQLRAFLREQGDAPWPHHLTLARLVARALRLGRSALIQTGSSSMYHGRHRLSYLISLLLWPGPALVVAAEDVLQQILSDLARLRDWVPTYKPVQRAKVWPSAGFQGILLATPQSWLGDRLGAGTQFPTDIPVIIDGADDLESWIQQQLTVTLTHGDWEALALAYPDQRQLLRDVRIQLTRSAFSHPSNPYHRYLLEVQEQQRLLGLRRELVDHHPCPSVAWAAMPAPWQRFWQQSQSGPQLLWSSVDRTEGQVRLHCRPAVLDTLLAPLWQQPVVLIGAALDSDPKAAVYRQRIGLGDDITCLKFGLDRHSEVIRLYLPEHLPLPNTPQFQTAAQGEIQRLLSLGDAPPQRVVILVGDQPLRAQLAANLAAEFGSRVRVDQSDLPPKSMLVCGWEFWRTHQRQLPEPELLIALTLPLPSLEDPLVAGRVAHYKRQHQDWFRLYLLPTALAELQRAMASVRSQQGMVALLDTRIHYRSYGSQIIDGLSPAVRVNSLEQARLLVEDFAPG